MKLYDDHVVLCVNCNSIQLPTSPKHASGFLFSYRYCVIILVFVHMCVIFVDLVIYLLCHLPVNCCYIHLDLKFLFRPPDIKSSALILSKSRSNLRRRRRSSWKTLVSIRSNTEWVTQR